DLSFRKLLDESEDSVELAAKMLDLVLGNSEARQMRYAADGVGVDGHCSGSSLEWRRESFAIAARSFRYSRQQPCGQQRKRLLFSGGIRYTIVISDAANY